MWGWGGGPSPPPPPPAYPLPPVSTGLYIQAPGITERSYILEKVNLEPYNNGTFLIFQERYILNPGKTEFSYISRNGDF